jgi:hypothetical protein
VGDDGLVLDRARIRALFDKLDDKMFAAGLEVCLYVVGGAAIALTLSDSRVTHDIDAKYESPELDALIAEVAVEEDIQSDWLNHSVAHVLGYFKKDVESKTIYVGKKLAIQVATPEMLLAMKHLEFPEQAGGGKKSAGTVPTP